MSRAADMAPPELAGLTLVRKLGSGGYASVYLYEQQMPRMRVAVKVLAAEGVSEQVRRRFTAEANAMAELADHPNIVQVFRAETTADGRPYLVMKYYPQQNLFERARVERLPVHEVLQIGVRISCAVETAHRAGILHRDIKPANILTSQYGEPGLADFGISTSKDSDPADEAEGMSVPWSPPEVLFSTSVPDERSDIYSLGATLWHLLAGRSPFEVVGADNSSLTLMRRIREEPVPRTGRPDCPESLERLLGQTLAKDPGLRPTSAVALARALQQIEVEQRWSPTPLVLDDGDHERRPAEVDEDERTSLHLPRRVVAQSPDPRSTFAPPGVPSADGPQLSADGGTATSTKPSPARGPRERVMPAQADPEGTVRRSVISSAVPVAAGGPEFDAQVAGAAAIAPPSAGRRPLVLAAIGIVALIVVVGVIVVLLGGKGHATSDSSTSVTPTSEVVLGGDSSDPSPPTALASKLDAGMVVFSWTPSVAGDSFKWEVPGAPPATTTRTPEASVRYAGKDVCIDVWEQSPGGNVSLTPATACGPG